MFFTENVRGNSFGPLVVYAADIIKPVVINHVMYNRCRFSAIAILNATLIESRSKSLSICLHNRATRNYIRIAVVRWNSSPGHLSTFRPRSCRLSY